MKIIFWVTALSLFCGGFAYGGPSEEFFAAVRSGSRQKVEQLLAKNKTLVFASDSRGMTPFLTAVEAKDLDMAYLLSDYFSRLGDSAAPGNAMHIAVNNEDEPMIKLLFRLTGEEDPELLRYLINMPRTRVDAASSTSNDRNTPLHLAAQKCNRQIYKYLVTNGANPEAVNVQKQTPAQLLAVCPKPEPAAEPAPQKPKKKPVKKRTSPPAEEPMIFEPLY